MAEPAPYIPIETSIERDDARSTRQHAPYKVGFRKVYDEKQASTNVEWLTQGELITLWQQIGVLFNLVGMRDGLTDDEIEKMGIHRGE